jgi:hypothetical protein
VSRTQHRTRLLIGLALAAELGAGCLPSNDPAVGRGTTVQPAAPEPVTGPTPTTVVELPEAGQSD